MEKKFKNFVMRLMLITTSILFTVSASIGQGKKLTLRPPVKMILMPDTVLRQAAFEILRLEKVVVQQDSTISDLKVAVVEKDSTIKDMNKMLTEADFREKVLNEQVATEEKKTEVWKGTALKYRRQRNWSLAGVTLVVVGGVVRSLKR